VSVEISESLFRADVVEARRQRVQGTILLTQPIGNHVLAAALFAAIALATVWTFLGNYARTEAAPGLLVTDTPSAKVIASRPGVVSKLFVREGQAVHAGDVLVMVQVEQVDQDGKSSVSEGVRAVEAQKGLAARQATLAAEHGVSERARLMEQIAGLKQQRTTLDQQISIQEEMIKSARQMVDSIKDVVEKGFISRTEQESRRQSLLAVQQQLSQLKGQYNSVIAQERQAEEQLAVSATESASAVANAQATAEGLAQQRAALENQRSYLITAPIDGTVTAVDAGPGRTTNSTQPLMLIVPQHAGMHVDVYAPTRAVGFLRPGQEVRLLYDAFPYQRFGSFPGRVSHVSAIVLDPRELSVPLKLEEAVYRVEVTPDRQFIEAFGHRMPLQPGMTLTANIVLDRRSFFEWLLEPLNAVRRRNG
jgi:membrane fusion protein